MLYLSTDASPGLTVSDKRRLLSAPAPRGAGAVQSWHLRIESSRMVIPSVLRREVAMTGRSRLTVWIAVAVIVGALVAGRAASGPSTVGVDQALLVRTPAGVQFAFEGEDTWRNEVDDLGWFVVARGPRAATKSVKCLSGQTGLDLRPLHQIGAGWRVVVMDRSVTVMHAQKPTLPPVLDC